VAGRIEAAAPLDCVHQQLVERLADRLAHFGRQIGVEVGEEGLDAARGLEIARHLELDPFRLGGDHLDALRRSGRIERLAHQRHQVLGLDRLAHVAVRLGADRVQQRLRRFVGGHQHHLERGLEADQLLEQLEPAHAGQPHVEQREIETPASRDGERGGCVRGLCDLVARGLEQTAHQTARHGIVVHDQDGAHRFLRTARGLEAGGSATLGARSYCRAPWPEARGVR
jgi:hypothetical protein